MKSTMVRVGINGFGRIGRLALRAASGRTDFAVVHINELAGDAAMAAHLLEFDSVHGRWHAPINADSDAIHVCGQRISMSHRPTPGEVDWDAAAVDVVIESSGQFRDLDSLAAYFTRKVRKVVVAAPVKGRALNIVMGVNDHHYDAREHDVVTAASCTTNCLAPIVKIVHERVGIRHGVITTVHDATNTQTIVDRSHKDLRRARSALTSLIPTTTGSASAIGLIYPELAGRLSGLAIRVPLLNASLTDCVFEVARPTTVEEINNSLKDAARGSLKGILAFEERPLVSADFVNDPHSAIIDGPSTMVIDHTQVKILAWYDNEWAYANRLVELTAKVASSLPNRPDHPVTTESVG